MKISLLRKWFCFLAIFSTLSSLEAKEELTYLLGNSGEKMGGGQFSLMSWNICALTGKYPTLYGGVRPAKKRVDEIANFILKTDADVVCLQEAHDHAVSKLLFEKLKETYSYFVINIGKDSLIQFNSGLFIASKFPIENFDFTPFINKGRQRAIKKGCFAFKVMSENHPIAYVVATHLQPNKTEKDAEIRLRELKLVHSKLLQDIKLDERSYPRIVCGDLNIDRCNTKETGNSLIQDLFFDPLMPAEKSDIPITCTNYLTYFSNTKNPVSANEFVDEPDESIDYCLILKTEDQSRYEAKIIEAYDKMKPESAISDHHAVLTFFNYPS